MREGFGFKSVTELGERILSKHDYSKWTVGAWRSVTGQLIPCGNGLHFTKENGLNEWGDLGNALYIVEYGKEVVPSESDTIREKFVARQLRLVKRLNLTTDFFRKFDPNLRKTEAWAEPVHLIYEVTRFGYPQTGIFEDFHEAEQGIMALSRGLATAILTEYAPEYL